jgi:hypothetical protein
VEDEFEMLFLAVELGRYVSLAPDCPRELWFTLDDFFAVNRSKSR